MANDGFLRPNIPAIEEEDFQQPVVDNTIWKRDGSLSTAIKEFEKSDPTTLHYGIEITNLPKGLNLLDDHAAARRLVTRKEQRTVAQKAFEISREWLSTNSASATAGKNAKSLVLTIRGSPGIGKSWSSLLYLKHLLHDKKRPIIFESGPFTNRNTWLLLFDLASASWTVYSLITSELPGDWFNFPGKDVVIDPAQFPSGREPQESPLIHCAGHIFIPVSPDDLHLGGTHKTASSRRQLVLGPWTWREISFAWPYMVYNKQPDDEEIKKVDKLVQERYHEFGGLPRYLIDDEKAMERRKQMTLENAKRHERLLLSALTSARIDDRKKVLTLFFTIYPGVNEQGDYDPSLAYSTVEFVSRGALRAAGQVVFHQINSDMVWRNASDASSVGLAFEAVCLMFLHMGTKSMKDMGIKMHCRQLVKDGKPKKANLDLGFCPYAKKQGSSQLTPIVDAADEPEFFQVVRSSGDTMTITSTSDGIVQLSSTSPVSFPPPGLANVDGMSGPRLGFQATLQENHPPSGAQYVFQRQNLGVMSNTTSAIVFTVPHRRYKEGWNWYQGFRWKDPTRGGDDEEEDATPSPKRRRGAAGTANQATSKVQVVSETERKKARESLQQFVLAFTLVEKAQPLISAPRTDD
jgi:hypothetical protein